jgi:hypothetical protein
MLKFERNTQGWMDVYIVDQTLDEDEEGYQTEAGHIIGSVEEGYRFVFPFQHDNIELELEDLELLAAYIKTRNVGWGLGALIK